MLCAPVFIFTSGSSALLGRPRCGWSIWLSLLALFNTLVWVYGNLFLEKTDKTREYSRKRTKHENTRSPPFLCDIKMAAKGYWARKALTERTSLTSKTHVRVFNKCWMRRSNGFNMIQLSENRNVEEMLELLKDPHCWKAMSNGFNIGFNKCWIDGVEAAWQDFNAFNSAFLTFPLCFKVNPSANLSYVN